MLPARSTIRFAVFELDLRNGELRKQGVKVKLQEQPFQILRILLERPNEVVTREELQKQIWPADTFVDFDHGLYNAVKKLREALGDIAETPRFIETLPKRGYRFIGEVKRDNRVESPGKPLNRTTTTDLVPAAHTLPQTTIGSSKRWTLILAAVGGLALILGLFVRFDVDGVRRRLFGGSDAPQIHSVAVLPLKNLSQDPAQEYFSYGMTEELITDLAQISGLKVISHTSVIQYAQTTKSLPQIARELGVDGIVEGTVQRSGDRVRITAQLIYAPQEQHLWAASYDHDFQDVLALQSSVATAIVESIRPKTVPSLSAPRKRAASPSLEALEHYLQGNYSLERMGAGEGYQGYQSAIKFFKRAISEDPNFAPAYVGLATAYDAGFAWRPNDIVPLQKAALEKALELDPESADAHLSNAGIKTDNDCDLPGAEREIKQALRLNPNLADAHESLSDYLSAIGRDEESIQEAQRAQELDPAGLYGIASLMSQGRYDRAIEKIRSYLQEHPDDGFQYINPDGLIAAYHFAGRHRESVEALQQAWTLFGFKEIGQGVGRAYAANGYAGAWRYSAKQMERLYAEGKVYEPNMIAWWYARANDKERSLKWIGIGLADNNHCWPGLDRDPDFTFLHSDPRFQELVKRTKMPH